MRMLRALGEYEIGGVKTLVAFHRALLSHPAFAAAETCRELVESQELVEAAEAFAPAHGPTNVPATADEMLSVQTAMAEVDGRRIEVKVLRAEPAYRTLARRRKERASTSAGGAQDQVVSPMQGTVLEVRVDDGDGVEAGAVICVVEAMKMENEVTAHRAGVVSALSVVPGGTVASGQVVCVIG
jgi:acetyl-CoA/propionyl-CoA carboxylase biotin carboxyl carrier protein